MQSPGTYVTEWVSRGHFCLARCSLGPPSRALVVIAWWGVDAVTWCGWDKLYKMRNYWKSRGRCQVYGLRLMGICLMIVCVLSDLTWLPLLGEGRKSWYIIIRFIIPAPAPRLWRQRSMGILCCYTKAILNVCCVNQWDCWPCLTIWLGYKLIILFNLFNLLSLLLSV